MLLLDAFKRVKCLRQFDPSLGILGFFIVSACLIGCLFYLDYRDFSTRFRVLGQSQKSSWLLIKRSEEEVKLKFLGKKDGECDFFDGSWVWDENYPLYESKDCTFLDEGFRCSENGRPDSLYTKWRWQPKDCNLPRSIMPLFSTLSFSALLGFFKQSNKKINL